MIVLLAKPLRAMGAAGQMVPDFVEQCAVLLKRCVAPLALAVIGVDPAGVVTPGSWHELIVGAGV